MKKIVHIFVSVIFGLSMLNGLYTNTASAVDYNGDEYVTSTKVKTPSGTILQNGDTATVNASYVLEYEWELPEDKFQKGEILNFSIPKEFKVVSGFNFPVKNGNDTIATAKVKGTDNNGYYIEMEFTTDFVETHSIVYGSFELQTELNANFVDEGKNTIIFPPDTIIILDVPNFTPEPTDPTDPTDPSVPGEGGNNGAGAGDPNFNQKKGVLLEDNLYDVNTKEDLGKSQFMRWSIDLGRKVLLGKAASFDEISSITVEDEPKDQELIPYKAVNPYYSDAFGFKKGFFDIREWVYDSVTEEAMGVHKNSAGYYDSFKMELMPSILKYEELAKEESGDNFRSFTLDYYTQPLGDPYEEREYENNVEITIHYKDGTKDNWKLKDVIAWTVGSGTITGQTTGVEFKKIDAASGDGLAGAKFDLYSIRSGTPVLYKSGIVSDSDGKVSVDHLKIGDYQFKEVEAPPGYELQNKVIDFEITKENINENQIIKLANYENGSETTEVSVKKKWDDNKDSDGKRPDIIRVQLYADNVKYGDSEILAEGDNWSHKWTKLPKVVNGKEVKYTVKEEGLTSDYTSKIEEDKDGFSFLITNTHEYERTKVEGIKTWENKENTNPPVSIQVQLFANGIKVDGQVKTVTADDNWKYSFTDLPKYENEGELINYTVSEVGDDPDYVSSTDGINITNTYNPATTSKTVKKEWIHGNNPTANYPVNVMVRLLADDKVVEGSEVELNAGNNWLHTWTELEKQKDGKDIVYTVEEDSVSGYTAQKPNTVSGETIYITNKYDPEFTKIGGTKTWDDENNQDGKRPESIQINLFAGSEQVDQLVVTGDKTAKDWSYEFTNLDKYDDDGKIIVYSVKEEPLKPYTSNQDGNNFTNSYTPEKTSVKGKKIWEDDDNQDGKRPDTLTVKLFADGVDTGKRQDIATDKNEVAFEFKDLDKYKAGKLIVYTVDEVIVDDSYTQKIIQSDFTIYNTRSPETVDIEGEKKWEDDGNRDGYRPSSVQIDLYGDGDLVASQIVTSKDNWKYKFENQAKNSSGGKAIVYTVKEAKTNQHYTDKVDGYNVTNTHPIETVDIGGEKKWSDNEDQDGKRPEAIKINLYADGNIVADQEKTITSKDNWKYEYKNLPKNSTEGKAIVYTVKEEAIEGYTVKYDGYNIENIHTPEKIDVKGKKIWSDGNDQDGKRPKEIVVELFADGVTTGQTQIVSAANNEQSYEFTDLPKYNKGVEIAYTVTEKTTIKDYDTTYDKFDITNKYEPELIDIEGNKKWVDGENQDKLRPAEITVRLLADGKEIRVQKVTTDNPTDEKIAWSYEFKDLPKYRDHGTLIKYTVVEDPVDEYGTSIDEFFNIVNTHKPEEVEVKGKKIWDDANDQDGKRPKEIVVELYADGVTTGQTQIVSAANNEQSYEFTNLPKYNKGAEISYTVIENTILSGYDTTYDKFDITNKYEPELIDIEGNKKWVDGENQDKLRPAEITVRLLADGKEIRVQKVTTDNPTDEKTAWSYEFKDLPKYRDHGTLIKYTVVEDPVDEYGTSIDEFFNIVNTHKPEEVDVKGEKTWDDKENQDGKRPTKIVINLLADGKQVDERIVTEKENWSYEFTNLPKYKKGDEIEYKVAEELIDDYSTTYDEPADEDVTNSYTPGVTARTVMKFWEDTDNQDGKRPDEIKVQLYANGEKLREPLVLNEANDWLSTWEDLDEMKDGKTIKYTVKELDVDGAYEVTLDDKTTPGTFVLVNNYTPELLDLNGKKTWDDKNNQDGKRPSEINVNLLANGEKINSKKVTEKEKWSYEFKDLPKKENGKEIIYTVTEDKVANYTTDIDGMNIENKYTPGKTSATVTKKWKDNSDKKGKRPTTISVQLYADGKAVGGKEKLNKSNKWTKTWKDLSEKKDGKKIVYTVKETTSLKDYEVTVDSSNIGNMIVTNKYVGTDVCLPNSKNPEGNDSSGTNNSSGSNSIVTGLENLEDCIGLSTTDSGTKLTTPTTTISTPKVSAKDSSDLGGNSLLSKIKLPKTGLSNTLWYVFVGAIIIIGGLLILRKRRNQL